MICFAFMMTGMTAAGWFGCHGSDDMFNIEILFYKSLVILDELWNNDKLLVYHLCHCVICLAGRSSNVGGSIGLWRLMVLVVFLSFLNDSISFGWNFEGKECEKCMDGLMHWIADLFPFLLVLFSKRKNKNHLRILLLCMITERLFSLLQRTKVCFMSFRVSLTPATILCLAILENANAFSIHVAGFKHKIYRWLCFCHLWVAYRDGARKSSRLLLLCRVVIEMSVMQVFFAKSI